MNKIRCQTRRHTVRQAQLNAGLAVGHPKYPRECTLPSYRFHHVAARSCTRAKPELAAAALTHLRRFVKPSLGGKAFETEPPVVFFPLDPKKRHLHWATWWVFRSSENHRVAFRRSEKAPPEIEKTRRASALPFSGLSRWHVPSRRGKDWECSYTCGIRRLRVPEVPAMPQVDSLACWMRHPNPFISLLSLMMLCSMRATSHEQPLETISLSAPEDCHRCGLLQLACAHRLFP